MVAAPREQRFELGEKWLHLLEVVDKRGRDDRSAMSPTFAFRLDRMP
jgi:hypothetical protein